MTGPRRFPDLRAFIAFLEEKGELVRIDHPVDPKLEMTEIAIRLLAEGGPAVLFTNPVGGSMPVLMNLFGTQERVGMAVGRSLDQLEELGAFMAELKQPEPPSGLADGINLARRLSKVRHMPTRTIKKPPCQEIVLRGDAIDLGALPIMTCWPKDAGPLVTWPLVITQGKAGGPVNIGIYRMQVIGRNKLIMRWLKHRGGAQHAREHGTKLPVAVAIGCDPGTIVAGVTPIPETLSEYAFAGLMREKRVEVANGVTVPLPVPATAEIVLEGEVDLSEVADEGPFGDHTGYYNEVEKFPVFTVKAITMRRDPIYLSTFTGRPPDEPSVLALALNRVFVPLLKKQYPEIEAFHLPMEACSYRAAVVSLNKGYAGHAFRVMTGVWGFLRQFLYTKYIVVVDAGVPVEEWSAVFEAIQLNVHAGRDVQTMTNTPIDYLDFASPLAGLGGKMGIDATTKAGSELDAATIPVRRPYGGLASDLALEGVIDIIPGPHPGLLVVRLEKTRAGQGREAVERLWEITPPGEGADFVLVTDGDIDPASWNDLLWALSTRSDPGRDAILDEEGRIALDATVKIEAETSRVWGESLTMEPAVVEKVSKSWGDISLPGSGRPIW